MKLNILCDCLQKDYRQNILYWKVITIRFKEKKQAGLIILNIGTQQQNQSNKCK